MNLDCSFLFFLGMTSFLLPFFTLSFRFWITLKIHYSPLIMIFLIVNLLTKAKVIYLYLVVLLLLSEKFLEPFLFKSSVENFMPAWWFKFSLLPIILTIRCQSDFMRSLTFYTFCLVHIVFGCPEWAPSSIVSRSFRNACAT